MFVDVNIDYEKELTRVHDENVDWFADELEIQPELVFIQIKKAFNLINI